LIPFTDRGLFQSIHVALNWLGSNDPPLQPLAQIILTLGDLGFVTAFGPHPLVGNFLLPQG
jgi:hypothetical protein